MFPKFLRLCVLLLVAATAIVGQSPTAATREHLLVRLVSFQLIDSRIKYEGVAADAGDVCLHYEALSHRGRNYYWSDAILDGLFVEGGDSPSRVYQPYDLAVRSGWHTKSDDSHTNDNVWGLFESGGKIWMGTNGLGILEFDPRRSVWSRYDWQRPARPDVMTYLLSVDENYMFFTSSGGTLVYSWRHNACAQLAVPLDGRIDTSAYKNGSVFLQIKDLQAKSSYYQALNREFSRLIRVP